MDIMVNMNYNSRLQDDPRGDDGEFIEYSFFFLQS